MKKMAVGIVCVMFLTSYASASTVSPDVARREHRLEMKKIKEEQRKNRKTAVPTEADKKMADFWAKEGERSGFSNFGSKTGNIFQNLNPVPFFKSQNVCIGGKY